MEWLVYGALAIIALVLAGWLSRAIRRAKPQALDAASGAIVPERISAAIIVAMGAVFFAFGLIAVLAQPNWSGVLFALFGLTMSAFMAPSLTSLHRLSWSQEGVDGASKTFGLTLARDRAKLPWSSLARTGRTFSGYWYLEAQDGRRVYWSYLYKGYGAFVEALKAKRPDLDLPADML